MGLVETSHETKTITFLKEHAMLVVRRADLTDLARMKPLADQVLIGEEVQLRVTRSGFTLSYIPLKNAEWRCFPPHNAGRGEKLVRAEDAALLLAVLDDAQAGLCAARMSADGWCEVVDLRVDAANRRQGIARTLLESAVSFAKKRGAFGLSMTVTDNNPVICQFLEHNGFRLHGVDNMRFAALPEERRKPLHLRPCALTFYKSLT